MSLEQTHHTKKWNSIPRKCKNCSKAIYTKEDQNIFYQCSIFGIFKRTCNLNAANRTLPKPEELLEIGK